MSDSKIVTPGLTWPGKGSWDRTQFRVKMTQDLVSILQTWQIIRSDWSSYTGHTPPQSGQFPGHRPRIASDPNGIVHVWRSVLECRPATSNGGGGRGGGGTKCKQISNSKADLWQQEEFDVRMPELLLGINSNSNWKPANILMVTQIRRV